MPSLMQRLAQQGTGGSVVEFSFTSREARVRFPPVPFSLIWIRKNVNDRKAHCVKMKIFRDVRA